MLFFSLVFIAIQLLMMNLILSVIVDCAQKVSTEDTKSLAKAKEKDLLKSSNDLKKLCAAMDTDKSGTLTRSELVDGYDRNNEFRDMLLVMDIKRDELDAVFSILDTDQSGLLHYDEFADELYRMKTQETHTLLVFIKFSVQQVRNLVDDMRSIIRDQTVNYKEQFGPVIDRIERSMIDGYPSQSQDQLQKEIQDWAAKTTVQHDQLLQHLRDLTQGQSSSRWRSGVNEAVVHSVRAGGTGASPSSASRGLHDSKVPEDPHDKSNIMPCWRVGKGTFDKERVDSKGVWEVGHPDDVARQLGCHPSGTTGSAPDLGLVRQQAASGR